MRKSTLLVVLAGLFAGPTLGNSALSQEVKMPLSERPDAGDIALTGNYDRFEDITTVSTPFIPGPDFYVILYYTCEGQNFCIPTDEPVLLGFFQRSKGWKYLQNRELTFLLNGEERINMGQISHEGEIKAGGQVVELMAVPVRTETLKRILSAEKAEYRLGTTTTELSPPQEEILTQALKEMFPEWSPSKN